MEVLFLGTGNAFGSGGRNPMAILVRDRGFGVLLDCGPATLAALKKQGLSSEDVDLVLISHHHGDHFSGVPFLVLDGFFEQKRTKSLTVAGPPRTGELMDTTLRLFFPGIPDEPFPLEYRDLDAGIPHTVGPATATGFEVDHYSNGIAFGYRVSWSGRTVVYSGDTAWTEELVPQAAGADLFVCECSSFEEPFPRHMSYRDLERNADRLEARRTLLVHAGEDVLSRRGELVFELADDGTRITL